MTGKKNIDEDEELTRREKFLEKHQDISKKELHSRGLKALQNQIRRKLLRCIGEDTCSIESLAKDFDIDEKQLKYHLDMLEHSRVAEKVEDGWKLTERGIGYLRNVENNQ